MRLQRTRLPTGPERLVRACAFWNRPRRGVAVKLVGVILLLHVLTGCSAYTEWRYRDLTRTAHAFLDAGARSDSTELREVATADPIAVVSRVDRRLLAAATVTLHPTRVAQIRSVAAVAVVYEIRYHGEREQLTIFFRRDAGVWKVHKFLPPGDI
jgi:hypothetical protein